MRKQKIIVILGQTATGKSDLAVKLAKKFGGEVVSADSRQVYRGLDLGTGKITKREMRGVPHHMLDVANPKKQFDVSQYKKLAEQAIADIVSRGKIPILCGGTGLYIDTVINGVILPEVKPNTRLRKQLENMETKELFSMLKKLDSRRAKTIDAQNPRRLIRAIEIAVALGMVPTYNLQPTNYNTLKIGLILSEQKLKQKIRIRLFARLRQGFGGQARISRGMIVEVRLLHKKGLTWGRMESLGLEYKYLALYLQKKISKAEMILGIEKDSWRYAKRQMTWFKRDKDIKWFPPTETKKIEKEIKNFLEN